MNTFRNLKKNAKALSPVVASIILIAVTVAVSVVVAAWMGGMSMGLMGNAEQVSINNVVLFDDGTAPTATVDLRNTGAASVTINSATIDGAAATSTDLPLTIGKGTSETIVLSYAAGFTADAQYQIKMITAKGNAVIYTATYTAP